MGWPIYSETFVRTRIPSTWVYYNVPAGHRAVVKMIVATNTWNVAATLHVQVQSYYVAMLSFPAQIASKSLEVFAVVYGGGAIGVYCEGPNVEGVVSGYLFSDNTGRAAAPAEEPPPADPQWEPPPATIAGDVRGA